MQIYCVGLTHFSPTVHTVRSASQI